MKSNRLFAVISVGVPLAMACADNTSTPSGEGGTATDGGGGNDGGGGSSGEGGSGGSIVPEAGTFGADCSMDPCNSPLVCCTDNNTCTPNSTAMCAGVSVACTKNSQCPTGLSCCIGAYQDTGSGPTGSVCAAACDQYTCGPGGVSDCPNGGAGFDSCYPLSNVPLGLGKCIPSFSVDGGTAETGATDGGAPDSAKDTGAPRDASSG